jgi:hypothetical protein
LAEEQAAFSAGFSGTDQAPAVEVVEDAEVVVDPVEVVDEVVEAEKPLTIEDLRAIIDEQKQQNIQHTTKLSGQIGELKQRQTQLEAARTKAAGISPKARERLTTDFPELAAMLFDDEAEPVEEKPVVVTPVAAKPEVDEDEAKEILAFDHPDWEKVVADPKFHEWAATLPPKLAKRLNETWDPAFVSGKITAYKATLVQQPKPVQKKVVSLETAVNPRGVPRSAVAGPGADDEETAAFKAAYKPRFAR